MCLSCGCVADGGSPTDDHGDSRNITLTDLNAAAAASGTTADVVARTIATSLQAGLEPALPAPADPQPVTKRLALPPNPKRFVLGVAYPSDTLDGHGEFMSSEDVEQACWDFMLQGQGNGFFHAPGTEGHLRVVENSIHRGPDYPVTDIAGERQVVKTGYWLMGAIADEPGFELIAEELADGWSLDGLGKRRSAIVHVRKSEG